jgi:hypothetical protein
MTILIGGWQNEWLNSKRSCQCIPNLCHSRGFMRFLFWYVYVICALGQAMTQATRLFERVAGISWPTGFVKLLSCFFKKENRL